MEAQLSIPERRVWGIVACLLAIHAGLLAYGAWVHSPTLNEPGHLVAGISDWKFGRFEVYRVNPPFTRMVAALPVIAAGCRTDWKSFSDAPEARSEFQIGSDFVAANGERSLWLFTIARWACIPISLAGGLFCFLWARELFNSTAAGLVALALWCFEPNIIAHGQLITPDMAATAFGVGAGYLFWRWLKRPAWGRAVAAGAVLGLAELSKTTWILLFGLWPAIWLVWSLASRPWEGLSKKIREIAQLGLVLVVGLYCLNLGYCFDGTLTKLGDFLFVSRTFSGKADAVTPANRFAGSMLGSLPVPLPREYVRGLDVQKRDFENKRMSYLRGEWKEGGWWYYYLYAFWVKTPHGLQLLLALAVAGALFADGPRRRDLLVISIPAIAVFAVVSSERGFNHHFRYVVPAFGFLFVFAGQAIALGGRSILGRWVVAGAQFATIASSLWTYPHSLSYFNELAGGPRNGYKLLLHSNVDWGQDVGALKRWQQANDCEGPFYLACEALLSPAALGVRGTVVSSENVQRSSKSTRLRPGWYAVSYNYFAGPDDPRDDKCLVARHLKSQRPHAEIPYTIGIYHVE